jgi:hypothetical protein
VATGADHWTVATAHWLATGEELVVMDSERLLFLVVGVVIVFAVGQLLVRSGGRYLAGSVPAERAAAGPAASLVAVLFHLLTLGLVALISVAPWGSSAETRFLIQLGVLLVVLAAVYAVALSLINRRRDEALAAEVDLHGEIREHELDNGLRVRPVDPPTGGTVGPGGQITPPAGRGPVVP